MADATDNFIIEHLRDIRGRVDRVAEDLGDVKVRMSSLGSAMVLVKREVTFGNEADTRQQVAPVC